MMRIPSVAAPPNYKLRVLDPGMAFLAGTPNPTNAEFRVNSYWSRVHGYMYEEYRGVCAYCASWMPRGDGTSTAIDSTVDHFIPKSIYPALAYEWVNLRVSRRGLNENKGQSLSVMDPMFINNDWFELDFLTCRIKPSPAVHEIARIRIKETLNILRLNDPPIIDERTDIVGNYAHERWDLGLIAELYPFIAREIVRQDIELTLKAELRLVHD
jgi:uncharacterized protein (TIGR02646 family)